MIRVLVVDDSSFMRVKIKTHLESAADIKVVGIARNGRDAIEKALLLKPDVITMDINMPNMSGIEAVEHIMNKCPTPIIMISTLTGDGAQETIEALEKGAIDYIHKDELNDEILVAKIRIAHSAAINCTPITADGPHESNIKKHFSIVGIGISTGGPRALTDFLPKISKNINASIVIAQHMPPVFTKTLAERLDSISDIMIKEAEDGEVLIPGWAYICPGGMHMLIENNNTISLYPKEEFPQYRFTPSADLLMKSMSELYGDKALCIIMTGMGSDGLEGIKAAKVSGSYVLSQSEASCTIYGMPKAVISEKLQDEIVHLNNMAARINDLCKEG